MPFRWRGDDGRFWWYMDPLVPHQQKKKKKKRCQSWTPSDKTFWIRACFLSLLRKSKQSAIYVYVDNVEENI